MKLSSLLFLIILPAMLFAQPVPDTLWTRVISSTGMDVPSAIRQTSDGGYIICGSTTEGAGSTDALLVRMDSSGNTLWRRTYGTAFTETAVDVRELREGGLVFVGSHFEGDPAASSMYLVKTDSEGDTIWTRTSRLGVSQVPCGLVQLADSSFFIASQVDSSYGGLGRTRVNANGQTTADTVQIFYPFRCIIEGVWYSDVEAALDGGLLLAGGLHWWGMVGDPDHEHTADVYCEYAWKQSSQGNDIWTFYTENFDPQYGMRVAATPDGGSLYLSTISTVAKFSASGVRQWSHPHSVSATDIRPALNGGYALLGASGDSYIGLSVFDQAGTLRWRLDCTRTGFRQAVALESTRDGGYVFVGSAVRASELWGIYVIKTGPDRDLPVTPTHPNSLATTYSLSAFPNPFNDGTTLKFTLPQRENAKVQVYDLRGRFVITLTDRDYMPGEHSVAFRGNDLASGIYFARISTPHFTETRKLLLLK